MVEDVQELGLQAELPPLSEWNSLGKRQVVIPEMGSVKPWVKPKCSSSYVLARIGEMRVASARPLAEQCGIDRVFERARGASGALLCGWLENADRILQLRHRNAVK